MPLQQQIRCQQKAAAAADPLSAGREEKRKMI
jgi:hypothetical protein